MAGKNTQLMTWRGNTDDFWNFIRRHRRLDTRTIYLYASNDPQIFVWSSRQQDKDICKTFRLKLHDKQIIPGMGIPKLELVADNEKAS